MAKRICAFFLLFAVLLAGCAPSVEERIEEYADEPIVISGLTEEEFTVTPAELALLELETVSATGNTDKAGTVTIVGPSLETFLEEYGDGAQISDFKKIRFYGKDDYKVVLKPSTLLEYDIILGIAEKKSGLEEKRQPVRMLIPEEDSGKWVYGVIRIEFVWEDE